jgi:3-hydroxybutyryl-CoA dehydrogenase
MLTKDAGLHLPAPDPRGLRVAIIGAGLMGHALGAIFAGNGSSVTICESDEATLASAPRRIQATLKTALLDPKAADLIRLVRNLDDLDPDTQFVTEAIVENLALKQGLLRALEERLPKALFATNTSVLCIGDVAAQMKAPERLLGTHWWNPPYLMPLVEVVQGAATRPDYVQWTMELLRAVGKSPVHARKDTPGFIGNRLQGALWREAFALIEEGVCDAETVDFVVRNTLGLKLGAFGPIENADYVGLDLTLAIQEHLLPALSVASSPQAVLREAIEAGKLGAKTGEGLLHWAPGAREAAAARLNQYIADQIHSVKDNNKNSSK